MGILTDGIESTYKAGEPGLIPGSARSPRKENGYPLQYFLPGEFHGQRSLGGLQSMGSQELDTTEHLIFISGQWTYRTAKSNYSEVKFM